MAKGMTRRQALAVVGGLVVSGVVGWFYGSRTSSQPSVPSPAISTVDKYLHKDYQTMEEDAWGPNHSGLSYSQFIDYLNQLNPNGYRKIYDRTEQEQKDMLEIFNKSTVKIIPGTGQTNPDWQKIERSIVAHTLDGIAIDPLAVVTNNDENGSGFFYFNQSDFGHLVSAFPLNPGA